MNDIEPKPWDQLPDEPLAAYRRFLVYRDLGPGRSVQRAVDTEKEEKRRNAAWERDCTRFNWKTRSTAWDIENMAEQGARTAVNFVKTLEVLASKAILDAMRPEREIRTLDQLLDVLNVIGGFITPEVIEAAKSLASGDLGRDDDEAE